MAEEYKFLLGSLGVSISLAKSVVPRETSSDGGELASRLVKGGKDFSPLPMGLLLRGRLGDKLTFVIESLDRFCGSLDTNERALQRGLSLSSLVEAPFPEGKRLRYGKVREFATFYLPLVY